MNAFVEARFYRHRTVKDLGNLVAVDAYGRMFPVDRINEEWIPGEEFEALPETTVPWELFITETDRLNPGNPCGLPMGNNAPIQ